MSESAQSSEHRSSPGEREAFPFPSIIGRFRLTLAPCEIAERLAVSEQHVTDLLARACLEGRQEPITGGNWVTVESLKRFLIKRLTCPISAIFSAPQTYRNLKWTHQVMATARGECWLYIPPELLPLEMSFVPLRFRRKSTAALTAEEIQKLFDWGSDRLAILAAAGNMQGIVDLRLPGAPLPVLRVPTETLSYWIRVFLAVGPAETAAPFLSPEIAEEIYSELGPALHALRERGNREQN